ncbi:hypothetical protein ACFONN_16130 [Dyella humi]|uniref:DUF3617 family protein n=1 Tax=Dyella humi TaxID=1770547 RepID=A0ABW8IMU0_9GAMM
MTLLSRSTAHLSRWSNPVAAMMLIGASAAFSTSAHADPADFQAMPGLWKITLHTIKDGHAGALTVKWKCFYDGADPWTTFVDPVQSEANCARSGEHRTSTALAWKTTCGAHAGHGRIALDSPQHYTGEVALDGQASLQVEGQRYAACTGPAD